MKNRVFLFTCLCLAIGIWLCGCTGTPRSSPPPGLTPEPSTTITIPGKGTGAGIFSLHVDALTPGSKLSDSYTCKGAGESPELSWEHPPGGTKSFVLIVDDPDAPQGTFTHWIMYNIPQNINRIDGRQPNIKVLANGAQQGINSGNGHGYYPVCPPIGPPHRYIFTLYALDYEISMPTADRDGIDWAINGHVTGQARVLTTFWR